MLKKRRRGNEWPRYLLTSSSFPHTLWILDGRESEGLEETDEEEGKRIKISVRY